MKPSDRPGLRVLFVTPECAPLTKTGGLGDVSAALPAALRTTGIDVRVLIPGYREVLQGMQLREAARQRVLGFDCRILQSREFFVLDCPELYVRDGGPYQAGDGADWHDNALRFAVLCKAATLLPWRHDVVHCNDWPTGLIPLYERRVPTILTVHNLAFQGNFDPAFLGRLGLPPGVLTTERAEFYGRLSFLKAGITGADLLTTVSPTYAREVQTEAFGCGMEGVLRARSGVLNGILNGIDTAVWNPATDAHLPQHFSSHSLEKKALNKAALQERLNLEASLRIPVLGMVSRMTEQKGTDLVAAAIDELAALPAQVAILGSGRRDYEAALAAAAARHPGRIAVAIGFNEPLAHLIEAGADIFLMPSRFEPCGLNQMYSQRYGTPPVARATGGLADTISDGETGFLFDRLERESLIGAVKRALEAYRDPARWRAMQRAGMAREFSWDEPARRYADLYGRLATRAAAPQS
jgi:starch synthase